MLNTDPFELWCWRRLLRVPWTARRSNTSQSYKKSTRNIHWKDCCWNWSSNTLGTRCEELTHWKRPWCWERLKAGRERDSRGWDGCMASPTRWTWVWVNSRSWWWTGRAWCAAVHRVTKSWTLLSDWSELKATVSKQTICSKVYITAQISKFLPQLFPVQTARFSVLSW